MPKLSIIGPRVPDTGVENTHPLSATQVEFMERFLTTVDSAKETIALKTLEGKIKQMKGLQGTVLGVDISPIVAAFEKFHTILSNNQPNVDVMKNAMRDQIYGFKSMQNSVKRQQADEETEEDRNELALMQAIRADARANDDNLSVDHITRMKTLYQEGRYEQLYEYALMDAGQATARYPTNDPMARLLLEEYEEVIRTAYGISIEQERGVPEINYEVLHNYQLGAEVLAKFFDEIMVDYDLDLNRYDLYRQIMGDMTIKRTTVHPDGGVSYGYNQGNIIYDIFISGRTSPMSQLNFSHELIHSFLKFSGYGNDIYSIFDTSDQAFAEIAWQTMTLIDNDNNTFAMLDPDARPLIERHTGLVIRGDYHTVDEDPTNDPDNNYWPTFRQNFAIPSNNEADNKEVLVDAIMYAAYGLFDRAGVQLDWADEMAIGIRQAALYHTSPEDFARILGTPPPLQTATGTGASFRINSPSLDGVFAGENGQVIQLGSGNNTAPDSFDSTKSETGTAQILGITEEYYPDTERNNNNEYRWIYVAIPSPYGGTQYYWAREDIISDPRFDLSRDWNSIVSEMPRVAFEALDPYRPFQVDDPYNPPTLQSVSE